LESLTIQPKRGVGKSTPSREKLSMIRGFVGALGGTAKTLEQPSTKANTQVAKIFKEEL
jgi:hypothetical protein